MDDEDDPGWREPLKRSRTVFVPGLLPARARRGAERGEPALTVLRTLWLSFVSSLLLIGIVVVILWTTSDLAENASVAPVAALALVVVGSAGSLAGGEWARRRRLDCSSLGALAASYRQRFFLRVAFANGAALVSFVGFVLSGAAWLYLIGLAVSLGQLVQVAPTVNHLTADQRELRRQDCQVRLVDALASPPPPPGHSPPTPGPGDDG